jgi:hypothetical protein
VPELDRHLHCHLDRNRTGIGEEDASEITRHQRREPVGERERLLMGKSAKHDMRHDGELTLDGGAQMGVVVAVTGRPPRRDAVDELAAIGKHDAAALRANDRQRRARGLHL